MTPSPHNRTFVNSPPPLMCTLFAIVCDCLHTYVADRMVSVLLLKSPFVPLVRVCYCTINNVYLAIVEGSALHSP
jgi:hypothetical protein